MQQIMQDRKKTALVLAGGGARAAYEVGVLQYLFESVQSKHNDRNQFDIFSGTSAGAINCCILASMNQEPARAMDELTKLWMGIELNKVITLGVRKFSSLSGLVFGKNAPDQIKHPLSQRPKAQVHQPVAGILDNSQLEKTLQTSISWDALRANLSLGVVKGVALCATEVCTGQPVVFYQTGKGNDYMTGRDTGKDERQVSLGLEHLMASSAYPFLFPSYQIKGVCYVDGGLRHNTPVNPAIRFQADRLFVISLASDMETTFQKARIGCRKNPYPGVWFLLERMLSALLTETLDDEMKRLRMFNKLIQGGIDLYGQDFLDNINRASRKFRNADWKPIRTCLVRPSTDLNELAVMAMQESPEEMRMTGLQGRLFKRLLTSSSFASSGILSRLMFTPTYIKKLIDLGYSDAQHQHNEIVDFFSL